MKVLALIAALAGTALVVSGLVGTLFAYFPANAADAGVLLREAPPFVLVGALWLWLARRLWRLGAGQAESRLLIVAVIAIFVARLVSAEALLCWALAVLATALALWAARVERCGLTTRRLPTGIVLLIVLAATFALPVWETHGPPPGPNGGHVHSHRIWELGHVH